MITVHPFTPSGFHTYDGGRQICRCGQVENSRVHDVPPTPDEVREAEARRLGESE